jgi:hypothetical protein
MVGAAIGVEQRRAVGEGARGNGPNASIKAAVSVTGGSNVVRQLRGAAGAAVCGGDDEGFAGAAKVAFHDLSSSAVVVRVDAVVGGTYIQALLCVGQDNLGAATEGSRRVRVRLVVIVVFVVGIVYGVGVAGRGAGVVVGVGAEAGPVLKVLAQHGRGNAGAALVMFVVIVVVVGVVVGAPSIGGA